MPGKLTLSILVFMWAEPAATAGNKIIPHLIQTPEFSTWVKIVNLCESPSNYRIGFFNSDGGEAKFAFSSGELWGGVRGDEVPPGAIRWFHLPESEDGSMREGYGEITDDWSGCIAFEVVYFQILPDERSRWALTLPARLSESGVATSFYASDSCDTAIALASDGSGVGLEILDPSGEVLGSADLGGIHHTSFRVKDQLHSLGNADGQHGTLKIRGKASAVNLIVCDGEIRGSRFVHPLPATGSVSLPSGEGYEVVSFVSKYRGEGSFGHKYSFRMELKNPTQTDKSYEFDLLFRDSDGFVIKRLHLTGDCGNYDFHCISEVLSVPAGQTRTFEGTEDWIYFDEDPRRVTVEPEITVAVE